MKLEGDLAFFHSNTGHEPETQSFEFNDNDLDSAGYKLRNLKVREYGDSVFIDFKNSGRDSDLSPHDLVSEVCMNKPKLNFSNRVTEAQVGDFVDPLSHSSNDLESFMKLPNDIEPVKRPATSPVSNPLGRIDSFENSVDVYMDRSVSQCEPEMVVCYRDSSYDVKDICVDEGVPKMDKVLFDGIVNEKNDYNLSPSDSYDSHEANKDNIEINTLILPSTEESDQVSSNQDQSKDLMHEDEDMTEKLSGNVNKEMVVAADKVLSQELDTQQLDAQVCKPSEDKGEQVSGDPELYSQSRESENMIKEAVLGSQTSAAGDESSGSDSILLENGTFTYVSGSSAPAACGKEECHRVGGCICGETQNTSRRVDGVSNGLVITSQDRHGLGESSFSAVGPLSGRISYSGPVPYSGSISLRSDSSTTSTRSFAFPILQNEWNSSPVRMRKAKKSCFGKHRGWRHGLLCCRF